MSEKNLPEITIKYQEGSAIRSIALDGSRVIGECDVEKDGEIWVIVHTEVDPAYGGQGIAGRLLTCLIEAARERGAKIRPVCSYAAVKMVGKEEYADVLE